MWSRKCLKNATISFHLYRKFVYFIRCWSNNKKEKEQNKTAGGDERKNDEIVHCKKQAKEILTIKSSHKMSTNNFAIFLFSTTKMKTIMWPGISCTSLENNFVNVVVIKSSLEPLFSILLVLLLLILLLLLYERWRKKNHKQQKQKEIKIRRTRVYPTDVYFLSYFNHFLHGLNKHFWN